MSKRNAVVDTPTNKEMQQSIASFQSLSAALLILGELAPERMTLSQAVFFILAGSADLTGKKTTFTDIKDKVGDTLNRSLHTTYRILMRPSRQYPKGLGWLDSEVNPDDNRVKFLRLTPEGRRVMQTVANALISHASE